MNFSIKDIKSLFKENKILKESLKQLKTRETLLINNIDNNHATNQRKENKWSQSVNEMKILQNEINGSILEMEKEEKDQLIATLQRNLTKSENMRAKFQKEVEIIKSQKEFLENQLAYLEKKNEKKNLILNKLQLEINNLKNDLKKKNDLNNLEISQLSNDNYETGTQLAVINKEAVDDINKKSNLLKNTNQEYYNLINELNDRFASTEQNKILDKIDKMIESIHLIPDLQNTILSIMDVVKSNFLINCGKFILIYRN